MHTTLSVLGAEPTLNFVDKREKTLKSSQADLTPSKTSVVGSASGSGAGATRFSPGGDVVRRVTIAEYKQAALCLAEAFADDEVSRYFTHTPDREHMKESQQWKLHVEIMEYITYAHILKGLVLTIGAEYGCVALW